MPVYFWMSTPSGNQVGCTAHTSCKGKCWAKGIGPPKAERTTTSMPKSDANMEASAVDLVGYKTSREVIFTLYQEVYQLKRAPGAVPGDPEEVEKTHQEILDSLKEHLWHMWGPAQLEEKPSKGLWAPKCQCRPNSTTRCRQPMATMATLGTGSRSHARRP